MLKHQEQKQHGADAKLQASAEPVLCHRGLTVFDRQVYRQNCNKPQDHVEERNSAAAAAATCSRDSAAPACSSGFRLARLPRLLCSRRRAIVHVRSDDRRWTRRCSAAATTLHTEMARLHTGPRHVPSAECRVYYRYAGWTVPHQDKPTRVP